MGNVPFVIGFAAITTSQLALGIYLVVLAAWDGGEAWLLYQEIISDKQRLRSRTVPANTSGCLPSVFICPTQNPGDRVCSHFPLVWFVETVNCLESEPGDIDPPICKIPLRSCW